MSEWIGISMVLVLVVVVLGLFSFLVTCWRCGQVDELETKVACRDQRIADLEAKLKQAEEAIGHVTLVREHLEHERAVGSLRETLQHEKAAVESELSELREKVSKLETEKVVGEHSMRVMRQTHEELYRTNEELSKTIEELRQKLSQSEEERSRHFQTIEVLKRDLAELQSMPAAAKEEAPPAEEEKWRTPEMPWDWNKEIQVRDSDSKGWVSGRFFGFFPSAGFKFYAGITESCGAFFAQARIRDDGIKPRERFINEYEWGLAGSHWESRQIADNHADSNRIRVVHFREVMDSPVEQAS